MKKIVSILLVLILAVGVLAACSNEQQKAQKALDEFTFEQADKMVSASFALPKTIGGFTVVWTSSNAAVLKIAEGDSTNYNAEYIGATEDTEVILTAVISTGSGDARRGYRVRVASNIPRATNDEYLNTYTPTFKAEWAEDYVGKDFWTEGIGEAVVDTNGHVDGDTTRFRLRVGNATLTVRYYAIDTPESTGTVEPWGVQASNFTKKTLNAASEIVLQATTNPPSKDSYQTRYLAYVWYRNSADEEFRCLNLELVENGYAKYTGSPTEKYPYHTVFSQANAYAKAFQLRVWSKLKDPLYNDNPTEITIKEFLDNSFEYWNADTNAGRKVMFTAFLTDLYISGSGTHTFTATQFDPETGERYDVNVYTQYEGKRASRDFRIGYLYKIVGNVQYYNSSTWQITDINLLDVDGKTITILKQKDYFLTFDSAFNTSKWTFQWQEGLYSDLTVKSVSGVQDGKLTFTAEANKRIAAQDFAEQATTFTFTVPVAADYDVNGANAIKVGCKLTLSGFQLDAGSGNISILRYADITKIVQPSV